MARIAGCPFRTPADPRRGRGPETRMAATKPAVKPVSRPGPRVGIATERQGGKPRYKRVLLKLSGEAFAASGGFGIENDELDVIGREVCEAAGVGTQVAVVVGGGNIIRGAAL